MSEELALNHNALYYDNSLLIELQTLL